MFEPWAVVSNGIFVIRGPVFVFIECKGNWLIICLATVSCLFRRKKGRTNIEAGLRKAIYVFTTYKGFAKDKEIYVLSDGKWNEGKDPTKSADKLRKLGVKIKVFAIGANPNKSNLKYIAGASCKGCYFRLSSGVGHQEKLIKLLTKREGI